MLARRSLCLMAASLGLSAGCNTDAEPGAPTIVERARVEMPNRAPDPVRSFEKRWSQPLLNQMAATNAAQQPFVVEAEPVAREPVVAKARVAPKGERVAREAARVEVEAVALTVEKEQTTPPIGAEPEIESDVHDTLESVVDRDVQVESAWVRISLKGELESFALKEVGYKIDGRPLAMEGSSASARLAPGWHKLEVELASHLNERGLFSYASREIVRTKATRDFQLAANEAQIIDVTVRERGVMSSFDERVFVEIDARRVATD